ncbi:hypothetical protein RT717_11125 [Imperialibacter roseus]|uniref:Uncharacterized protein n=1 Tax=Imperialibacter roseus TaxID=1324217 RepID=A0ABZ0IXS8_9BACT|nr:hypothetical protein [Imperialibacter roseus]WOK09188.1 hypothetical protein RT717_11125 [Imperialibacter roseus]
MQKEGSFLKKVRSGETEDGRKKTFGYSDVRMFREESGEGDGSEELGERRHSDVQTFGCSERRAKTGRPDCIQSWQA